MSSPVASVSPQETLDGVYNILRKARLSCLAVVENEKLVGVVSRTDLLREGRRMTSESANSRHVLLEFEGKSVAEIMTPKPAAVGLETSLSEAAKIMVERSVHRVFVTDSDKLAGVVSTLDLMAAIRDAGST